MTTAERHGTTTLFAALDVATGEVVHECLPRHRHQEFLRFLRKIERSVASELDIHVILDNYATHKHPAVRAWLDKHPRVHFHFIPTSSSWLNLVERFFSELTTRQLKRLEGQQSERDFGYTALAGVGGLTKTGSTLGTASYMSPEQAHGEDVGAESDVWSLGAVLYEMLAGEEAFDAANAWALIYAITSRAPAPLRSLRPEVPAEVEAVVMRALEKAPADRFAAAEKLASALELCLLGTGTVVARPAGEGRRAR